MHAALDKDAVLELVRQAERLQEGHLLSIRKDFETVVEDFLARVDAGLTLAKKAGVSHSVVYGTVVSAHSVHAAGRCTELAFRANVLTTTDAKGNVVTTDVPPRCECFRSMTVDAPRGVDPNVPHVDVYLDVRGLDVSNRHRRALGFSREQSVRSL